MQKEKNLQDIGIPSKCSDVKRNQENVKGWKDKLALHNLQSISLSMKMYLKHMMNSQNSAIKHNELTCKMGKKHSSMFHQREGISKHRERIHMPSSAIKQYKQKPQWDVLICWTVKTKVTNHKRQKWSPQRLWGGVEDADMTGERWVWCGDRWVW